jgi:exopolyphosphatase/pppGpp-phosphohydrolase
VTTKGEKFMDLIPDLWEVEQIATTILPYVHSTSEMKYYTNHARDHSEKLLFYIDEIIKICDLSEINLNEVEKSILKCACWLHDLGCIYDRETHADESLKIIEILCQNGHLDLKAIKDEIKAVVQTHSTSGISILEDVDLERKIKGYSNVIRLKLLCVLFKLADECHIDRLRAPEALYDILKEKMPDESKSWWVGHEYVTSTNFSFDQKKIIVIMDKKGNPEIAKSLANTLRNEQLSSVLKEYKFPCTELEIEYEASE